MTPSNPNPLELRILVFFPSRQEAEMCQGIFRQAALESTLCTDLLHLGRELEAGAAAILTTEEPLLGPPAERLFELLARQPRWSDLPVLVVPQTQTQAPAAGPVLQRIENVVLLSRPLQVDQVLSAVRSAIRARRRQYELRDHLAELAEARQRLKHSEQRYRTFVEATNQVVWRTNPRGEVDEPNPTWTAFTGQSAEQAAGFGWLNAIHPDDRPRMAEAWNTANAAQALYQVEYRLKHHDGQWRQVLVRAAPVREADGSVREYIGTCLDVTELRQTEAAAAELKRKLDAALLAGEVATWEWNLAEERFWGDRNLGRIFGVRLDAAGIAPLAALLAAIHPDDRPHVLERINHTLQTGAPYEAEYRVLAGGQTRWVVARGIIERAPSGQVLRFPGVLVDITQQKRTEAALQRRNEHLQILHQAAADLLLGRPPVDLLRGLQHQIARTFGADLFMLYEAADGNGRLQLQACAGVSAAEQHKLATLRHGRAICAKPAEALQPIIATHIQTREVPNQRFLRKLGLRSYLYYPLLLNGRLQGTLAFASRRRDDYDSTDLDFFHAIAGTIAEALARHRLETELQHHAAGLERTVQERTAKLRETIAELEGFSYSLVHDLRAPLRAMLSYAGILELESGGRLRPEDSDLLRKISLAARRMDQLVTDSLNYSRILRQNLPLRPVHLGALLRGMVETYPNFHPPQADVSIELGDLLVHGNEAALTQVFSNLLANAVKFVAPGVHPRVRVWAEPERAAGQAPRAPPHGTRLPPHVRVFVQDNGIGIPRESQETIFGMFQRLHRADEYPGTGIGLALVRKSLERTGGHISLESEPGQGSRFCVELPRISPNPDISRCA